MKRRTGTRVIAQKKNWDCGIAALGMLLDRPYGDVMAVARALWLKLPPNKRGLTVENTEDLAIACGQRLRRVYRKREYLANQTGMLGLLGGKMSWAGHWVILKAGAIIDPDDGTVWDALDYLKANKTRPCTLLVKDE